MKKLFFSIFCLLALPALFFIYGVELVDINNASLEQLDTLTGIGPALGQRIIDNRPYISVDDLLKVQGIGEKNLEKIKQQGIACVSCKKADPWGPPKSTTSQPAIPILLPSGTSTTTTKNNTKSDGRQILYTNNILISEILPSPEGPDTENEFIEIFNANNFNVDLTGWKIKDSSGATKTYALPENTMIKANEFLAFKSIQTKISLNNDGDGVQLLNPSEKLVDSTNFEKSKQGQSWSKMEDGWIWTAKPTPNEKNILISTQTTASSSLNNTTSSKATPFLANTQSYSLQGKNFLAVSVAVFIAFGSAAVAWKIKKKATEI